MPSEMYVKVKKMDSFRRSNKKMWNYVETQLDLSIFSGSSYEGLDTPYCSNIGAGVDLLL